MVSEEVTLLREIKPFLEERERGFADALISFFELLQEAKGRKGLQVLNPTWVRDEVFKLGSSPFANVFTLFFIFFLVSLSNKFLQASALTKTPVPEIDSSPFPETSGEDGEVSINV